MDIKLTVKQTEGFELLESEDYTEILFDGGVRAGKSFLVVLYLLKFAIDNPGTYILIGRRYFRHCIKSLYLQTIEPLLIKIPPYLYTINKSDWIIRFSNGSQMWLSGFDDSKRINEIMGREYLMAFLNEATEIHESMVDKVKTRLAQKVRNGNRWFKPKLIFDCNPVMPEFYLNRRFSGEDKSKVRLRWTVYDNKENLTTDFIEELERNLRGFEKDRLIYGKWVGSGDYVYKNINEKIIMDSYDIRDYDYLVGGVDWGYISGFSLWGISGRRAECIGEVESKGKITSEFVEEIEDKIGELGLDKSSIIVYADHEPDRIEEMSRKGFKVRKAYKNVAAGDSTVNWFDIGIMRNCSNTYRSMLYLQNKKDSNGNIMEGKHIEVDDHLADSARYALHSAKMELIDRRKAVKYKSSGGSRLFRQDRKRLFGSVSRIYLPG